MTTNIVSYPCGLANLGNTCFLNTCVQLLNYIDELASISLPPPVFPENGIVKFMEYNVFSEWLELRKLMVNAKGKMPNPVASPGKFVHTIHHAANVKGYGFTNGTQNDLSDFLQFMIECIHNSKKRIIIANINGKGESYADDLALQCYTVLKQNYERGDYSEISN